MPSLVAVFLLLALGNVLFLLFELIWPIPGQGRNSLARFCKLTLCYVLVWWIVNAALVTGFGLLHVSPAASGPHAAGRHLSAAHHVRSFFTRGMLLAGVFLTLMAMMLHRPAFALARRFLPSEQRRHWAWVSALVGLMAGLAFYWILRLILPFLSHDALRVMVPDCLASMASGYAVGWVWRSEGKEAV